MRMLPALRREFGITQKQLAEKVGLAVSTIAMYETGDRRPSISTAKRIADYFNVTIEYIFFKDIDHEKGANFNNNKSA